MAFHRIFAISAVTLALVAGVSRQALATSECDAGSPPILQADDFKGVRTKWKFSPGSDLRYSIAPDTAGLSVSKWYRLLEGEGVNLIELNVEPRYVLARSQAVPDSAVDAYLAAQQSDAPSHGAAEALIEQFQTEVVPEHRYTVEERDRVLVDFLKRLEDARRQGDIGDNMKFILHQRIWYRPGPGREMAARRRERAEAFAADMSGVINLARENCLDHWIAGIRQGENGDDDASSYLPILVEIAKGVNARTNGWLDKHVFLANGLGMGAVYTNVAPQAADFFGEMSKQTGSFAFGYKWMQFPGRRGAYIQKQMSEADCGNGAACDPSSVDDWKTYLGVNLGLNELVAAVRANHSSYPNQANVVFVGDSSDSVLQMVHCSGDQAPTPSPALAALEALWPADDAGWKGRVFMNGYVNQSVLPRPLRQNPDCGLTLFVADGAGDATRMPHSIAYWAAWPSE